MTSERQGQNREILSDGSLYQSDEPMNKNLIERRTRGRINQQQRSPLSSESVKCRGCVDFFGRRQVPWSPTAAVNLAYTAEKILLILFNYLLIYRFKKNIFCITLSLSGQPEIVTLFSA